MVDDDEDTDCICSRCTWGGGSRILEQTDVWKMENMFLLLATLVCTGFLNGHHSVVCPCRCCMSWEGGLKSTPRANPHQYPNVVAITKVQKPQSWKRRKAHSPPPETKNSYKHTYILGLPRSRGPKCSAAGDGGGEGGKFVVSSTAKGQNITSHINHQCKRFWGSAAIQHQSCIQNVPSQTQS